MVSRDYKHIRLPAESPLETLAAFVVLLVFCSTLLLAPDIARHVEEAVQMVCR